VVGVVAKSFPVQSIEELAQAFKTIDTNGDGLLSLQEVLHSSNAPFVAETSSKIGLGCVIACFV
jgi:hypothetical protein